MEFQCSEQSLLVSLADPKSIRGMMGTLFAALSEEEDAVEEMYEPYLMQIGSTSGRELPRRQTRFSRRVKEHCFGHGFGSASDFADTAPGASVDKLSPWRVR